MTITISLAMFLPSLYTASALILVEGQQIPQEYVRSTVTAGIDRRLQVISQEILSWTRLEGLINQLGLYEDLKKRAVVDEEIIAAMRQDIGIKVQGNRTRGARSDTVAFEVSYSGFDPQKVMQVANILASFYIEGDLKFREQQSLGTANFLRVQLDEIKKNLEGQEHQIALYKQRYMGELPDQLSTNIGTLTLLEKQMEILSGNLARAQERRIYTSQFAGINATRAVADTGSPETPSENNTPFDSAFTNGDFSESETTPAAASLAALRNRLAVLQVRLSDKHPEVIRTKQAIAALEEQTADQAGNGKPKEQGSSFPSPLQNEQATLDAEIRGLTTELEKGRRDIIAYQQRIENAPKREQELSSLTRDYDSTRERYATLLKQLDEANLSDSLEQNQKAERFRLLEPAGYPKVPVGPKRIRLFLVGLVLGLGAAVAGVVLRAATDPSLRRLEDLTTDTEIRILAVISPIIAKADRARQRRRQWLGVFALTTFLFVLASASYRVVEGNEQLARALVIPASGISIRP